MWSYSLSAMALVLSFLLDSALARDFVGTIRKMNAVAESADPKDCIQTAHFSLEQSKGDSKIYVHLMADPKEEGAKDIEKGFGKFEDKAVRVSGSWVTNINGNSWCSSIKVKELNAAD